MKLYDFIGEYKAAYDLLMETEDMDILQAELMEIKEDFDTKVANTCAFLKAVKAEKQVFDDEAKRLKEKAQVLQNKYDRVYELLATVMRETFKHKVTVGVHTAQFQKNPPAVVIEKDPPEHYWNIVRTVDKTRVKEDLKAGKVIPGCSLVQSESLRIK